MSIFGDNPLGDAGVASTATETPVQTDTPDVAATETPVVPASEVTEGVVGSADATPTYFDPENFKDHLVKLKVAGEDVELPLSEALQNAMRGADYTRKTQELAEERRRLHQADMLAASLDSDPARTLKQLAEIYDLDSSGLQPVQREPDEQRLVEQQRSLAQQQAALQQQRIQMEIQHLTQQYGVTEGDLPAVADFALRHGVDLETAYKAMSYESMRQAQQQQVRTDAAQNAARNAQVVHSGANTQRGAVNAAPETINSVRDAWRVAEKQLKLT